MNQIYEIIGWLHQSANVILYLKGDQNSNLYVRVWYIILMRLFKQSLASMLAVVSFTVWH